MNAHGSNAPTVFSFQNHEIRTIQDDDNTIWFVAMDVATVLEYSDAQAMTRRLDPDEIQNRQIVGFGNRGVNLINEPGLYSCIFSSQKPDAKAFKKWVTSEVLPQIRKTGSYHHRAPEPARHLTQETMDELTELRIQYQDLGKKYVDLLDRHFRYVDNAARWATPSSIIPADAAETTLIQSWRGFDDDARFKIMHQLAMLTIDAKKKPKGPKQ